MSAFHSIIALVAEVAAAKLDTLTGRLAVVTGNPADNALLPLSRCTGLHFASLAICESGRAGLKTPRVVLDFNFDGEIAPFLDALCRDQAAGLQAIFDCCVGFPAAPTAEQLRSFVQSKVLHPNAWHIGNVHRGVQQVRDENRLRLGLRAHLDQLRQQPAGPGTPTAIKTSLVEYARGAFPWALEPGPSRRTTAEKLLIPLLVLAGAVVLGLLVWQPLLLLGLAVALVLGLVLVFAVLRAHEQADDRALAQRGPLDQDFDHLKKLGAGEDYGTENHLTSFYEVKPGLFRRGLLWAVLFAVNLVARLSTHGKLGGIPSIHFAHWVTTDGGRELLFHSNFDNSWGSYLDDFSDKASVGLTAIWSNTVDFPHTRCLIKEGAKDGARFKIWARLQQSPIRAFYIANPGLSVANIDRNSAIRDGLSATQAAAELTAWLKLL